VTRPAPQAVIPPTAMSADGKYDDDRWKRWCQDHGVSLLAFVQEGLRRRRLHGVDLERQR
jgi:hypothetical protein